MLLNLGVRAHDFGKRSLDELGRVIASHGLHGAQFSPPKSIPGFEDDAGRLSPGFAVACREGLARHGVQIAALGCYFNLVDPDQDQRRRNLERFKSYLRHARDFGCSIVATETGSLHSDLTWHPANHGEAAYAAVLESVAELLEEAERFGVFVGIEGVAHFTIHSPERIKRLLDDLASTNLQVVFDPVNLLGPTLHQQQQSIIEKSFDLFGDRICLLHLKDSVMTGGAFRSVAVGTEGGLLDTALVLRRIQEQKPGIQIVLEDTHPDTLAHSVAHVRKLAGEA